MDYFILLFGNICIIMLGEPYMLSHYVFYIFKDFNSASNYIIQFIKWGAVRYCCIPLFTQIIQIIAIIHTILSFT